MRPNVRCGRGHSEGAFERIGGIESRLLQFGALLIVAVLAMVHHLSCVNLPRWEDRFPS